MADIPVEKRSGNDMWKWLGGLALLAVIILLVITLTDTDENGDEPIEQQDQQEQEQTPQQNGQSSDLIAPDDAVALPFIAQNGEWRDYTIL